MVVYETPTSGMAQQLDGGVFLCITAAHLLSDAKLPDIQANIKVCMGVAPSRCGPRGEFV